MSNRSAFWTEEKTRELLAAWEADPNIPRVALAIGATKGQISGRVMKLNLHHAARPAKGLAANNPSVIEGRTVYRKRVMPVRPGVPVLKPGNHNAKLGRVVTKGRWKGMPIYSLTLEERATCPKTCHQWRTCFGNAMQWAVRNEHGEALMIRLNEELFQLNRGHPQGFVVRLHVLGDFVSAEYVYSWKLWLSRYEALHVFGYTHHPVNSTIGKIINHLPWDRFAIRFSSRETGYKHAITIKDTERVRAHRLASLMPVVICPAQTGKTASCGTCALCWSPSAKGATIAFLEHG